MCILQYNNRASILHTSPAGWENKTKKTISKRFRQTYLNVRTLRAKIFFRYAFYYFFCVSYPGNCVLVGGSSSSRSNTKRKTLLAFFSHGGVRSL